MNHGEDGGEALGAAAALRRGATRLARRLRMERPDRGETLLQLSVLGHLSRRGAMSPGDLAAIERVQPQSLTRTLTGLEERRLITRGPDPSDGRRSLLTITDAGRCALRDDMRQRDTWLAAAMAAQLTTAERELLRIAAGLMERLAETDELPRDPNTRVALPRMVDNHG
ncbi:MarR family transcriptional regulator [Streptomyces sp. RB6PN25]|uniref:MarR family transcriptional regulator n=1 Tax=Streptomyces humicola TaxID=2953240 RepID=A0ABT1PQ49_9ACTN|nr:MarR family transcriptional regulator [Streptomyces humicola]MCQ4079798.1 MarR family transcriptional regulator [Streptomyces humicola]